MKVQMVGTQPLLMHNVRLADDQSVYTREIGKLTAKRSQKTEEDKKEIDRLSFAGGLYYDDKIGPYLPAENIFRCLMEAGSLTRSGKKIERGLIFGTTRVRLEYDGPRNMESLWGDGDTRWVDRRMVAVQRQRIPRVRPIFPEWSASLGVEIDPAVIDPEEFGDIVVKAGKLIGIGDYRRFYGRFTGTVVP